MSQTHHDQHAGAPTGQPADADRTAEIRRDAHDTQPVWYGPSGGGAAPRQAPAHDADRQGWASPSGSPTGYPTTHPGSPSPYGAEPAHAAFGAPQSPAGPPPPASPREGAEHAQPAKPRRWAELTAVAALAAVLASGGTYAATQLDGGAQTSSTASSSSSLGRGTDQAPVQQADAANPNWTATAAAVSPSVVAIAVQAQGGSGQGSGVVIDREGHVLTNNHVVTGGGQGARITVTLSDGRTYRATIAGTDPSTDLAVLTLQDPPDNLEPVALGDSDALKVGDPVMAVGNPLGLAGTVTTGIVSALDRPVTTSGEDSLSGQSEPVVTNAIQTSAAINPGNSGGALVNAGGQLVGINSSIATLGASQGSQGGSIGIGFAIPVNEAKTIATQLIEKGSAQHALLGVTSRDGSASDGSAERAGATIAEVQPGTPAAEAGLRSGDTVIAVNGERVDSSLSLVAQIRERTVGDNVTLKVLRDGKELELTATLTAKSDSSS
ncbi:trypsin-like peptidase domain-containing protein [Knoellia sp. p5-6-4]|uniref:trypsin-like peptidase domain-containing protein n=1 Tax=unclassified Knoellia TaxID=2618719 RepID=UPI0023D9A945|nr:trypsin-like peptidase domain-containing protein [Knoellia sp. p5-6-4]MDF2145543.1 trypsin-like peptidase domain-containing protein [Knoellia sp. p5-6-4]